MARSLDVNASTRSPAEASGQPVLEVHGLSKVYETRDASKEAIREVGFSVRPREFLSIVGPSGAGKTTLLRCLTGLLEPTSGTVRFEGAEITEPPSKMALVFQDYGRSLFPWLTVAGNVSLPLRGKGIPREQRAASVARALEAVGLPDVARRYPWQLSGGMQQRVALARALAYGPDCLVMDEPFASVDAQTRFDLEDLVLRLQAELGVTVVFVTHDIDEAALLADRIAVMREGAVVQFDTPVNVIMRPADRFVAELVGADDLLRRLSLVSAATAMVALEPGDAVNPDEPAIDLPMRVRPVLSILLETGAPRVIVRDGGEPVGYLDLPAIQAVSIPHVAGNES
jgi:NitT/TauT family transport system ATP-binding protein